MVKIGCIRFEYRGRSKKKLKQIDFHTLLTVLHFKRNDEIKAIDHMDLDSDFINYISQIDGSDDFSDNDRLNYLDNRGFIHTYQSEVHYFIKARDLFNHMERFHSRNIDGMVVTNALRLVYHCGLSKDEVTEVKIGDVRNRSREISDEIQIDNYRIPITHVKEIIQNHLAHLKDKRYSRAQNKPLFPMKNGSPYGDQIYRDLDKIESSLDDEFRGYGIGINIIRHAGICNYYERQKSDGLRPLECLWKTMGFARATEDTIINVLRGQIEQTRDDETKWLKDQISGIIEENLEEGKVLDRNELMKCREKFFESVDNNSKITRGQKRKLKKLFEIKFASHNIFFRPNNVSYKDEDVIFIDPDTIYGPTLPNYVKKRMNTEEDSSS